MNILKTTLLMYPLIAHAPTYGMELSLQEEPSVEKTVALAPRVPSLRKTILSKIGSLITNQNCTINLEALKRVYPGAARDCARALAEDQRVVLWNRFGAERTSIELNHNPLLNNDLPDNIRKNTVFAATFTPNNKFLITLSCRREAEDYYVVYVWRMSDICSHIDATQRNSTSAGPEKPVPLEPIIPLTEFVLRRVHYNQAFQIQMCCNQTSSHIFVALPQGDCYFLKLGEEGNLTRLWRFNVLPKAKIIRAHEGTQEETELYQDETNIYVKSFAFNSTGNKALMHVSTILRDEEGVLYCMPLEDDFLYGHFPTINVPDHAHKIADEVNATTWEHDTTILYINKHTHDILYTVDTHGNKLGSRKLQFENTENNSLRSRKIQMRSNSDEVIIFSTYVNGCTNPGAPRIDRCSLNNGICTRLLDQDKKNVVYFADSRYRGLWNPNIHMQFLSNERFALKIFSSNTTSRLYVLLCDIANGSYAIIAELDSEIEYTYALSPNGSYLFLSDHPNFHSNSSGFNMIISLQTPRASSITLEDLISLCKK